MEEPDARIRFSYGIPDKPSTKKEVFVYSHGLLEFYDQEKSGFLDFIPFGVSEIPEIYSTNPDHVKELLDYFSEEVGIGGHHSPRSHIDERVEVEISPEHTDSDSWESASYDLFSINNHPEAIEHMRPIIGSLPEFNARWSIGETFKGESGEIELRNLTECIPEPTA